MAIANWVGGSGDWKSFYRGGNYAQFHVDTDGQVEDYATARVLGQFRPMVVGSGVSTADLAKAKKQAGRFQDDQLLSPAPPPTAFPFTTPATALLPTTLPAAAPPAVPAPAAVPHLVHAPHTGPTNQPPVQSQAQPQSISTPQYTTQYLPDGQPLTWSTPSGPMAGRPAWCTHNADSLYIYDGTKLPVPEPCETCNDPTAQDSHYCNTCVAQWCNHCWSKSCKHSNHYELVEEGEDLYTSCKCGPNQCGNQSGKIVNKLYRCNDCGSAWCHHHFQHICEHRGELFHYWKHHPPNQTQSPRCFFCPASCSIDKRHTNCIFNGRGGECRKCHATLCHNCVGRKCKTEGRKRHTPNRRS